MDNRTITPDMANMELQRRQAARDELFRRQQLSSNNQNSSNLPPQQGVSRLFAPEGYIPQNVAAQPAMQAERDIMTSALFPEASIAKFIPKSSAPLKYISNAMARIGSNTGQGALFSATSPTEGNIGDKAAEGAEDSALASAIFESIPLIGKGIGKGLDKFGAQKQANSLITQLGQGAKTQEQNAKSLAEDIRNAHDYRESQASAQYDPVLKKYGNEEIYPLKNPSGYHAFRNIPEILKDDPTLSSSEVYEAFINKPTFQNAHRLQSQLGIDIGKIKRMEPTRENEISLKQITSKRNKLKEDMDNFLAYDKNDIYAADQYKRGSDLYKNNVVPYKSDDTLSKIVEGNETNPINIHEVFKSPSDLSIKNKHGVRENKIGPINKVINDLPEESKGKILFSKLGTSIEDRDPEILIKALKDAKNNGYSSYIPESLDKQIESLSRTTARRNLGQKALSSLSGGLLGSFLGPVGAAGGLIAGNMATPAIVKGAKAFIPKSSANSALSKELIKQFYKGSGKAFIPGLASK